MAVSGTAIPIPTATSPACRKSRLDFWEPKLAGNRLRDLRDQAALKAAGWRILVVWECELGDKEQLKNKLKAFLEGPCE